MNKKVQISVVGGKNCDWLMLAADSLARQKRLLGNDVSFFAPDNEFNQVFKISSEERNSTWVDQISTIVSRLQQTGAVYLKVVECSVCEKCGQPEPGAVCSACGGNPINAERACYYLRFQPLTQQIHKMIHANLILPPHQRNDILNSLGNPTPDALIAVVLSREEKKIMPMPWLRILAENLAWCSYPRDEGAFSRLWTETYMFVPRELLEYIFYWSGVIVALGLPWPAAIVCHNCLQIMDLRGHEVSPMLLAKNYGYQGLRYFMFGARGVPGENNCSEDQVIKIINHDLANELGSLVSRVVSLVSRFGEGIIPSPNILTRQTSDLSLRETALDLPIKIRASIETQELFLAVKAIKNMVGKTNRFIESNVPWQLADSPDQQIRLSTVLYSLCEALRFLAISLKPLLPEAAQDILQQLGLEANLGVSTWSSMNQWGLIPEGIKLMAGPALFPRILPGYGGIGPEPDLIMREELTRIKMLAARIVSAEAMPDYEGLLQLILYDGRQRVRVIAPVAHSYAPSFLSGKKVVLIANLRPVETEGVFSEGEVLVAESETGSLVLVFVDDVIPEGSKILCLS